jgi:hypothetical protein
MPLLLLPLLLLQPVSDENVRAGVAFYAAPRVAREGRARRRHESHCKKIR